MGKTHAGVYSQLRNARVVAVVDPRGEHLRGELEAAGLACAVFPTYSEAASAVEFDVADVCLPTDLHRENVLRALADGKHVFCEKPIALSREDAREMVEMARRCDRQFMVGHCIRFWPEYVELKRMVDAGEHGRLLALSMSRRNGRPGYSIGNWVNQPDRCIGAALDLHIHDADFILHLLGPPEAVFARGLRDNTGWSSLSTQYIYDGKVVTAEGAWNCPPASGFHMRFSAVFERAVLDFDSRAQSTLQLTVEGEEPHAIKLTEPAANGYERELAYFVGCIERGEPVTISTGEQAAASLSLVLTEIQSASTGQIINLNQ
jgi:predicted dehydrogenase